MTAARRRAPGALGVLAVLLAVLLAGLAVATEPAAAATSVRAAAPAPADPAVLTRAMLAVDGSGAYAIGRPEATLALRDLFSARRQLEGDDALTADGLLARPTDRAADPYGDGYRTRSQRACAGKVCVHHVRRGADAPPSAAWVRTTLRVVNRVWRHHVEKLHYRAPAPDGRRGGGPGFDVYLKDLGGDGLYGYCAPERRVPGSPRQASGFCVLDNDFARSQYGRPPLRTLRVTAAHEFFHAVQFAYDFREDPWLLESTATWMEERFAGAVNDNRVYLPYGQLGSPRTPLDEYQPSGFAHYGNWIFWEYLSQRFGVGVVRAVIRRAGTGGRRPGEFSVEALRRVLDDRAPGRGLRGVLASYAAGLTAPDRTFSEGAAYPEAPTAIRRLRPSLPRVRVEARLDHLASRTLRLRPGRTLSRGAVVSVTVNASGMHAPAVRILLAKPGGRLVSRALRLNAAGYGAVRLPFSRTAARWISVTAVNGSARYRCDRGTMFACSGVPRDDGQRVVVTARITRS